MPWWQRSKTHFQRLFYDYDKIPPEPLEMLQRYYESRWGLASVRGRGGR
jgi:hypothetical protein